TELPKKLAALGFTVLRMQSINEAVDACQNNQVILIAAASWLTEHAEQVTALSTKLNDNFLASPVLVAIADTLDFRIQVKARQLGARLLLDLPLDATRLITELAGLAWIPHNAYRVMLVDDDSAVLAHHANLLKTAGFEVLALDDPVAARDFITDFAPEACVLDVEMPACRGTDLTALLRRDKHFTRLPVIYLSAFGDVEHQLDARRAGSEDYLVKPVDPRLLIAAVTARAQQFRLLETAYHQRRDAWFQLDNLRTALDAHAIVSVAAADGTIIDANPKFCELSGYSRAELIGHSHRMVKSGHHPAVFFDAMWQTLSAGRTWRGEVKNRSKDGSPYWVKSTIVPMLDELGAPKQYLSIRTDITAQKRIQAKRQHQNRLLDLLRQILQQYLASPDIEASSSALLEGVLRLTDSAYGCLGEVLYDSDSTPYLKPHALSHISWDSKTGQLWLSKQTAADKPHDLDNLVATVMRTGEMATATMQAEDNIIALPISYGQTLVGIVVLSNRPDGFDASSLADFLQPFVDTYANIIEAARQRHFQQQVILDLQRAKDLAERANQTLSALPDDRDVKFQASLSAIIAHSEMLQIDNTLDAETRQHLVAILKSSQQLARLNTAASADAVPQLPTNTGVNDSQPEPLRILVAEDNPANQAVLRMQLSVLGYSADIAADGAAAMLKWQSGGHVLLLTDRNMPGMDGLELTRAIRATEKETGSYIPIIAITAAQHPEESARCRQSGHGRHPAQTD
ncbi:MAG: response regulator, partial [Methylobacter sp.]|nr:response regulator [Methylobacter sp.]